MQPDERLKCPQCGTDKGVYDFKHGPFHCACGFIIADETGRGHDPLNTPPSVWRKGANYTQAWLRWKAAGSPVRSDEAIAAIRAICQGCEHYDDGTCKRCGCGVKKGSWLGDKVAWATESCPEGLW